jgi:hypothetical protein
MNLNDLEAIQGFHRAVYVQGELFGVDSTVAFDPLQHPTGGARPNSIAVAGGAFGDEGKGRVVDELRRLFTAGMAAPTPGTLSSSTTSVLPSTSCRPAHCTTRP